MRIIRKCLNWLIYGHRWIIAFYVGTFLILVTGMKVLNGHNQVNFTCPIKLPLGKYLGTECTLPVCKKYMHYLHMAFFFKLSNSYLLNLPLFAGVSRVRALSPAWNGSHAREILISRTTSPQQQKSSIVCLATLKIGKTII